MIIQSNAYHVARGSHGMFMAWRGSVYQDFDTFCEALKHAKAHEPSKFHPLPSKPSHQCHCKRPGKDVQQDYDGSVSVVIDVSNGYPCCYTCGGAYEEGEK